MLTSQTSAGSNLRAALGLPAARTITPATLLITAVAQRDTSTRGLLVSEPRATDYKDVLARHGEKE
ncbi:hypothetical protein TSAR_000249 [Trichomalopsis sarcophagae]|uniref:Uncharacterized protein n=1 Tax=Trichomalopsis sarcophagae TaxID=543379 RepID=A0A232F2Y0_9HYME|nr:hypothetical protein TSAR_000249 [Trichomalopsis sarcophagae]